MTRAGRYGRATGAILGAVGAILLLVAGVLFTLALPGVLGSEGEHMAGDAMLWLLIIVLPLALGAVVTLVISLRLWRDRRDGPVLLVGWLVVALAICLACWQAEGNALSSLRRVVAEGGAWSLNGVLLSASGADGVAYYGYLDNPTFWLPAFVSAAGIVLAVLLVAWGLSPRARA